MNKSQVIYNLSIYLQTDGETIPPGFKSSLKYCLKMLATNYIKPPVLPVTSEAGEELLSVGLTRKEFLTMPMEIRRRILKEQSEILAQFDSPA